MLFIARTMCHSSHQLSMTVSLTSDENVLGTFPSRCSGKVPHLWIGLPPWVPLSSFFFLYPVTISSYRSNAPWMFPWAFCRCSDTLSWDYHQELIFLSYLFCPDIIFPICASHYIQNILSWEANKIALNNGGDFVNLWESSSQTFGTGQMLHGELIFLSFPLYLLFFPFHYEIVKETNCFSLCPEII